MKKSKLVGIDISHHNELYHAAMGWDFVIHKMSEGVGHIDDQFPEMLARRNEYGIRLFGVYHYVTRSAAEKQAKFVKDLFENYNLFGETMLVLDWEDDSILVQKNPDNIGFFRNVLNEFTTQFSYWQPIIYTNKIESAAIASKLPDIRYNACLWLADYKKYSGLGDSPTNWPAMMRQYSTSNNELDINVFGGNATSFKEFIRSTRR